MHKQKKVGFERGFTLVEIMIVVAIVGLLVSIAIPNFLKARTRAQANTCIEHLRVIDGAKHQWALEHRAAATTVPTPDDIKPYLGRGNVGNLPSCPLDSAQTFDTSYTLNDVQTRPDCQISPATHLLP